MRKLIILRGAPGSGKTTFVKNQGLEPYAICPDDIRLSIGGIVMDPLGRMTIDQGQEPRVWRQLEDMLDQKMQNGAFIVLDATFQRSKDFKMPLKLAQQHRYDVLCVDFSDISLETSMRRNKERPDYKHVPEEVIEKAYERLTQNKVTHDIKFVASKEYQNKSLLDEIDIKSVNLDNYKKVHHIGDLQGCYAPVAEYFQNGFNDDEFYIFVGDFLDRGIQNGEVIRWIVDDVMERPNVLMIWGNHEYHIHRFATGQLPISKEFEYNTMPQLEKAGFTKNEANRLCNKLHDCFIYEYGAIRCFVNHAGIARVPDRPVLLSSKQYWKGTGTYDHPVDQTFSDNMENSPWIQVHGHRNAKNLPAQAAPKSYNLEAEVEFGGCLRVLTLDKQGRDEVFDIKNDVYRKSAAKRFENDRKEAKSDTGKISQDALDRLLEHDLVSCKNFKSYPHVRSYNFTRKAFTKGHWDEVNITARGLFVDDRRNIVARSYSKFFNLNEREETQIGTLEKELSFPITLYVKENGFLGILGYDEITGDLFFASKSTPEGPFASWFKEIFTAQVGEHRLDYIRRMLRDRNLGMVFEVNDPSRDPHMIEYEVPHVVLLDIVYRTQDFKRVDFNEAQKIAKGYSIPFKQKAMTFRDPESFNGWYKSVEENGLNYTVRGKHVEGFVVEDSKGFMFKIKLPYYSFWKYMRSIKDRILTIREKGGDLSRDLTMPEAQAFYEWANKQPDDVLRSDIITLRKMFEASLT